MRIATWNCSMALHRKFDAMLRLRPDIAVICECAEPRRLQQLAVSPSFCADAVWIGDNRNKGLAVFAFNGYAVRLAEPFHPTLRHVAPVRVTGPVVCNLLAVRAQNGSGGVSRKHQLGPLRRALTKYRGFLLERSSIVAGDFNNNVYWHRPVLAHQSRQCGRRFGQARSCQCLPCAARRVAGRGIRADPRRVPPRAVRSPSHRSFSYVRNPHRDLVLSA